MSMDIWHDLKKFKTGRTPEGHDLFSIPLPPDEDGMIGRECPQDNCQPKYFKISTEQKDKPTPQSGKTPTEHLYCPYCGYRDDLQKFMTRDQLKWVKSMVVRDIHQAVDGMFKDVFGTHGKAYGEGLFSVKLEYKPGILPSVRHYAEKDLKRVVECDKCGGKYAVYGIAIYCPWCGEGNLEVHLTRSAEIIKSLIAAKDQIVEKAGRESEHHLLGNCLEDCVSLFEGFLKAIYASRLRQKYGREQSTRKINELGNSFQQLSKAEKIFMQDFDVDLFSDISEAEQEMMELQFAKRHVITHNLGLVDNKFKRQMPTWQAAGQDISLDPLEIERLLTLIQMVLRKAIAQ
jgi:hypothetical protein